MAGQPYVSDEPHVFSKARVVKAESMNSISELGLCARPSFEVSCIPQKVGMIMSFAPWDISSLNASGKARSQQMSKPALPNGVSKASWASRPEEER
jgi:hypothetical protein